MLFLYSTRIDSKRGSAIDKKHHYNIKYATFSLSVTSSVAPSSVRSIEWAIDTLSPFHKRASDPAKPAIHYFRGMSRVKTVHVGSKRHFEYGLKEHGFPFTRTYIPLTGLIAIGIDLDRSVGVIFWVHAVPCRHRESKKCRTQGAVLFRYLDFLNSNSSATTGSHWFSLYLASR